MSEEYSDLAISGWYAAGDPPMVWDGRGDAVVSTLPPDPLAPAGRPYFEPDMAAFIVQVVNGSAALEREHREMSQKVVKLIGQLATARGLLMDCWHQLDGDVYVLPSGEVHPGAVTTLHALHAYLWPEGKAK